MKIINDFPKRNTSNFSYKLTLAGNQVSNPNHLNFTSKNKKNRFQSLNLMFTLISNSFYLMFSIPKSESV
jgi:hypothetical protein